MAMSGANHVNRQYSLQTWQHMHSGHQMQGITFSLELQLVRWGLFRMFWQWDEFWVGFQWVISIGLLQGASCTVGSSVVWQTKIKRICTSIEMAGGNQCAHGWKKHLGNRSHIWLWQESEPSGWYWPGASFILSIQFVCSEVPCRF